MQFEELRNQLGKGRLDKRTLFQIQIFHSFGIGWNAHLFLHLACRLPRRVISTHSGNLTDLESIIFGQSGLLPETPPDAFCAELLYRYGNFKYKYDLLPLHSYPWQFRGVQANLYPTIRLAQLVKLYHREPMLFEKCTNPQTELADLRPLFQVDTSDYWIEHEIFGEYSDKIPKNLAENVIDSILKEGVAPFRQLLED